MKTRLSLVSVSIPFAGVVMSAALALAVDQVVTDPGDTGGPGQLRAKLTALQSTGGGTALQAVSWHDNGTPRRLVEWADRVLSE